MVGMVPASGKSVTSAQRARCIVWHAPHAAPPEELLLAVERPDLDVVRCRDEYAAMALVCRGSGPARERVRRRQGQGPGPIPILLIVEPALVASGSADRGAVARVLTHVRRYAPRAAVWIYEAAHLQPLRALTHAEIAALATPAPSLRLADSGASSATGVQPGATIEPKPTVPLAGPASLSGPVPLGGGMNDPIHPFAGEGAVGPSASLSDAELSMLLSPEGESGEP